MRYVAGMDERFLLAHLTDVHLGPVPWPPLRLLNAKRLLGLANWHRGRRRVHLSSALGLIVEDLARQRPGHIAVTGDLANLGLPREHEAAARWLATLGPPEAVTAIPGNHDIYSRLLDDPGIDRWRDYMSGSTNGEFAPPEFPFVRRIGRVALIGLNSAVETRPFSAIGRLGSMQLERLSEILLEARRDHFVRVVLIHHPPVPGLASPSKALADASDLAAVLVSKGAELVLHGHNHTRTVHLLPQSDGRPIPIVGAGSASRGRPHAHEPMASYHLYAIDVGADASAPHIEMTVRGLAPGAPRIEEIERRTLSTHPAFSGP